MRSGPQRNRHGIPLYGGDPERCCWNQCPRSAAGPLKIRLCQVHADYVYEIVRQDRERMRALIENVRAANGAEPVIRETVQEPREEVIYYVQVGGHIKIGWTSGLEKRMRQYPPNTTLLAVHPGSRADEKQLHKRFAVHRSHGQEWYPLVPVILDHIKRVIAEHGEPPETTFGARPVEVPMPHRINKRERPSRLVRG